MGIKASIAAWAAKQIAPMVYQAQGRAVALQEHLLQQLIRKAQATRFGSTHSFGAIRNHSDFTKAVLLRDYEDFKSYIEEIADGKPHVLWPGKPLYFCKSSGTTSGTKYIPATREQINAMVRAARNALLLYAAETGNASFFDHQMIFLQGSPELEWHGKIPAGRLSGIVYHHVPFYARANRLPSYPVNCIGDWEEKVEAIARETLTRRMSLISGIPPWCVMYFEKLQELSGKAFIQDIFPDFQVFAYGGVNYEPYRAQVERLIGRAIDSVETYPASEGFIAYQDSQHAEGLLLNVNGGLFFEFVKPEDLNRENPERLTLREVSLHENYAVLLSSNAGLWAYNLGDTVQFVSKNPYRIKVTGRVKHFISAFGEHVISEEVEWALQEAVRRFPAAFAEFTVAPQVTPKEGLPYHEWFIAFRCPPDNLADMETEIDTYLQQKNSYYRDLRQGKVLRCLKITPLPANAFVELMKRKGKLGGQNKVPRLTNDRQLADELAPQQQL